MQDNKSKAVISYELNRIHQWECVNTHELKEGDFVISHGVLFQLHSRKDWGMAPDDTEYRGSCVTFKTDLIVFPATASMPKHWAEDWTVQGNKLASWLRFKG
ncbi:hypothetical protein D3C78_1000660 [compost metagenome]